MDSEKQEREATPGVASVLFPHGSTRLWTVDEIRALPQSGDWFFGVVVHEGRFRIAEVLPGYGYVPTLPYPWWHPRSWWWLLKDVYYTDVRKARALTQTTSQKSSPTGPDRPAAGGGAHE